jgi:ATP-binding cassette subfamily C (CFTR/MRP) protein 10
MGFIYASLMLVLSFTAAICDFNFNFYMNKIALKVRAAILVALYDKLLQLPQHQLSNFSSGQLINFMSTDVDRIVSFCTSFHAAWSMPFNIVVALYLLYREVGLAFLSGLFCALLMVPLNKFIATKIGEMSVKLMAFKDQRLKLVTEIIRSIRTVKVSNWEPYFEGRINEIRHEELKYLKWRKYLDAICVYLWVTTPLLIIIAILTTYTVIMEEKLTPAKVFTSLALINILILPLNAFPWVLNSLIEAFVSKRRLDKFFGLKSILPNYIYSLTESADQLLVLDEAQFMWPNGFSVGSFSFTGTRVS